MEQVVAAINRWRKHKGLPPHTVNDQYYEDLALMLNLLVDVAIKLDQPPLPKEFQTTPETSSHPDSTSTDAHSSYRPDA